MMKLWDKCWHGNKRDQAPGCTFMASTKIQKSKPHLGWTCVSLTSLMTSWLHFGVPWYTWLRFGYFSSQKEVACAASSLAPKMSPSSSQRLEAGIREWAASQILPAQNTFWACCPGSPPSHSTVQWVRKKFFYVSNWYLGASLALQLACTLLNTWKIHIEMEPFRTAVASVRVTELGTSGKVNFSLIYSDFLFTRIRNIWISGVDNS